MSRLPAAVALLGLLFWAACPVPSTACPFCAEERGPTLISDFDEAMMVLLGTWTNPKLLNTDGLEIGTTDFAIEEVLKNDKFLNGKKTITVPRYYPNLKGKFVIFVDVFKGVPDAWRAVEVKPSGDMARYLRGALELRNKPIQERLRYCFDFLQSSETEVSLDAYREYARADYKDYQQMAANLDPERIVGWLKDPNTRPYRYGLYASLLGHCGSLEHGKLLRQMMDDPRGKNSSGIDGLLAGYVMLLHKHGKTDDALSFLRGQLDDPKEDFNYRWALVRTLRFFWESRRDVFEKKEKDFIETLAVTLKYNDIADFGIDDFNRWNRWELADRILDLTIKEPYRSNSVIQKAVLRYALRCPAERARKYVEEQRRSDPEAIEEAEAILRRQFKDFQPRGK